MWKLIARLTIASCCCWVLYRWWLGRRLVYRCLSGMANTKPERRLTTQKQLTLQTVPAPKSSSTTPLRYWYMIPQLNCPQLLHWRPEVLLCPELHQQGTGVLHEYVCYPNLLHRGSQVLLCPQLLTTPMAKVVLLCSQLLQRGSGWLLNPNGG
jgi:hypothetical protein